MTLVRKDNIVAKITNRFGFALIVSIIQASKAVARIPLSHNHEIRFSISVFRPLFVRHWFLIRIVCQHPCERAAIIITSLLELSTR